jgi:hypothetical protein
MAAKRLKKNSEEYLTKRNNEKRKETNASRYPFHSKRGSLGSIN